MGDIEISKKKGYTLFINNDEPDAIHIITYEKNNGQTDQNLIIVYREDLQTLINELNKC